MTYLLFEIKPYGGLYTRVQAAIVCEKKPLLILNNKIFKVRNLITGINSENKEHKTNTKGKIIFLSYGKTGNQIHQL